MNLIREDPPVSQNMRGRSSELALWLEQIYIANTGHWYKYPRPRTKATPPPANIKNGAYSDQPAGTFDAATRTTDQRGVAAPNGKAWYYVRRVR